MHGVVCISVSYFLEQWTVGNSVLSVHVMCEHLYVSVLECSMWMCLLVAIVWPAACVPVQLGPRLYLLMTTHLNKLELGLG